MLLFLFFFFNDTATTEIYTLSLHDALPICGGNEAAGYFQVQLLLFFQRDQIQSVAGKRCIIADDKDRKSTRLNSSHLGISYAVFCLKKKKKSNKTRDYYYIMQLKDEYSTTT